MRDLIAIVLVILALSALCFSQTTSGLNTGYPIFSIAITSSGTIFCTTEKFDSSRFIYAPYDHIFESTDGGMTWLDFWCVTYESYPNTAFNVYTTDSCFLMYHLAGNAGIFWQSINNLTPYAIPNGDSTWTFWQQVNPHLTLDANSAVLATHGNTAFVSGTYYGDYGAASISSDGGVTWTLNTSLDSLLFYKYTNYSGGYPDEPTTRPVGIGFTTAGCYYALRGGLFYSADLKNWTTLPFDSAMFDSVRGTAIYGRQYFYNGDTVRINQISKLFLINDTAYVFLDISPVDSSVGTSGFAKTLIWQITDPDSVGSPADTSRFPNNITAVASGNAPKEGSNATFRGPESYTSTKMVVLGTSDGKVIVNRETVTSVKPSSELPKGFSLAQNYPNPFNPTTVITYDIAKGSHVTLTVYDVLGRQVAMLVNADRSPGEYQTTFDGGHLGSGVYFYRLQAGNFVSVKKLVLVK